MNGIHRVGLGGRADRFVGSLGIDVGSLYVKFVWVRPDGVRIAEAKEHRGRPVTVLRTMLEEAGVPESLPVGVTGPLGDVVAEQGVGLTVDPIRAAIQGVRERGIAVRHILDVGGGSLARITIDDDGQLLEYSSNSLCAAGTGSFLDEQARRLGLDMAQIEQFRGTDAPPTIATRCAVFAKSDLIHRQQEGYGRQDMWSGLCRGLVGTILQTLCGGRTLSGPTIMIGGVSRNPEVLRWLAERLGDDFRSDPEAYLLPALGAANVAAAEMVEASEWRGLAEGTPGSDDQHLRQPLQLVRSEYPSMAVMDEYVDERGVEVRRHVDLPARPVRVAMGIDIGSTSTKVLLMRPSGEVLLDLYCRTSGDPIGATKRLFASLSEIERLGGARFEMIASATTGSGRKLVGQVIGADVVVNEISAHVAGAQAVDPEVETIFEIGGQDAKFMDVRGGFLRDVNMNYVCAAGTGSFVEEQAIKLGFPVQTVGQVTEGIAPPVTSDRCTVFMEQDVHRLLRQGYQREEVMAAVLYSVVQNYLNRVVGNRRRSEQRISFQGATARNRGLVAAFENLLGVEVVVSPLCHQMGAYGAALLAVEAMATRGDSSFRGLDLANRSVTLDRSTCELCHNVCTITTAEIEGEADAPSWGYLCGRDPEEKRMRRPAGLKPVEQRARAWRKRRVPAPPSTAPVIGIPRALGTYDLYPLWRAFFEHLGFRVKLSGTTSAEIAATSVKLSGSDFCYPMKLAHGHAVELLGDPTIDHVFMPFVIQERFDPEVTTAAHLCPLNIAATTTVNAACAGVGIDSSRLLSPPLDMAWSDDRIARELHQVMAPRLGLERAQVRGAWDVAYGALGDFRSECRTIGADAVASLDPEDGRALVLLGRGYNLYDEGANVALPRKIAERGWTVIPGDTLPLDEDSLGEGLRNMFWWSGRRILEGARFARDDDRLHAVMFTNFSCGPDSFVLTYLEKVMGEDPYLVLELDEHGTDGGYLTRIEAFVDVLGQERPAPETPEPIRPPAGEFGEMGPRTLWLPPMCLFGAELLSATFRGHGIDSRPLPHETQATFEQGKALCRGTECLPAPATLGTLLSTLEGKDPSEHALFMPTAHGPCRFGQYNQLTRMALDRMGLEDVFIVSPASDDTYSGMGTAIQLALFHGVLLNDVLTKMRCRVRPYVEDPERVNDVVADGLADLERALEQRRDTLPIVRRIARRLERIPRKDAQRKPLVGIVGEIYVRCNTFCNQDVIGAIEEGGGEAWLSPISEWIFYTQAMELRAAGVERAPLDWVRAYLRNAWMERMERRAYAACGGLLDDQHEPPMQEVLEAGSEHVPVAFEGETIVTIGRAIRYLEDGAAMVVNCAPFTCMPGALTSAVLQQVQEEMGAPVISLFYDGTGDINRRVVLTLRNLRAGRIEPMPAGDTLGDPTPLHPPVRPRA